MHIKEVLDFHPLVTRKKYRYVILVQKRTQENEITKRSLFFMKSKSLKYKTTFIIRLIILRMCVFYIIYFSYKLDT